MELNSTGYVIRHTMGLLCNGSQAVCSPAILRAHMWCLLTNVHVKQSVKAHDTVNEQP